MSDEDAGLSKAAAKAARAQALLGNELLKTKPSRGLERRL
jgi:hypothetical protein